MLRKKWPVIILLAVLVLAALLLYASAYVVREGEYVYITQFGALQSIQENAGLHFRVPFIQDVNRLTRKLMIYNVAKSEVLTRDKKAMYVDSYTLWRINDVLTYIRTVNSISNVQKFIDASVYSVIKNFVGQRDQSQIITDGEEGRLTLNREIREQVAENMRIYGVEISSVEINRYDLPDDNVAAVYDRMISERARMAAQYKAEGELEAAKIRNNTDREVGIMVAEADAQARKLQGEGEQEYMRILKELYSDDQKTEFYLFTRELESLRKTLQGNKTLILGPDSPLAQMLKRLATSSR